MNDFLVIGIGNRKGSRCTCLNPLNNPALIIELVGIYISYSIAIVDVHFKAIEIYTSFSPNICTNIPGFKRTSI